MTSRDELLIDGVCQTLVEVGLVRTPSNAGTLPPMWREPRNGVPAPGQSEGIAEVEVGDHAVLGLFKTTAIPMPRYEQTILYKPTVEIWIRVDRAPLAFELNEGIEAVFKDIRDYNLANGLWVSESLVYRELQKIDSGPAGFTYNTQYIFEIWAQ